MHELHYEERAPAVGCAGVKDLGNVLVVHHGQGLLLGLEAGDDLVLSMPGLMILRATLRWTGLSCSAM